MQSVIVALQVYHHTKSEFSLGLIGAAEFVPFFIVGLFGGHVADIMNRKRIVEISTAVYFLCACALLFISLNMERITPVYGLTPIYLVIMITGVTRSFFAPAQGAFIAQILPRDELVYAATVGSLVFHISSITGSAAGGLVYGWTNAPTAYIPVTLFSLISLTLFYFVNSRPMPDAAPITESVFTRLSEGLRFVFKNEMLISALALDMFAVLFGGAVAMIPAFVDKVLHSGPETVGILRAAPSIGSVLVAMYLAIKPPKNNAGIKLLISVAGFGLCIIGFALSKQVWLSFLLLFLSGAFDGVSVVIRGTIVPLFSPDHMRGRIESVNKIFIGSSNELGEFESGTAARFMGLVPSVIFGGCMTLLIVCLTAWISPNLRKLKLEPRED